MINTITSFSLYRDRSIIQSRYQVKCVVQEWEYVAHDWSRPGSFNELPRSYTAMPQEKCIGKGSVLYREDMGGLNAAGYLDAKSIMQLHLP